MLNTWMVLAMQVAHIKVHKVPEHAGTQQNMHQNQEKHKQSKKSKLYPDSDILKYITRSFPNKKN